MSLESVHTRDEAFNYFNGYASDQVEGLKEYKSKRPLIKSYMLETVPRGVQAPDFDRMFHQNGCILDKLDDTLYRIQNGHGEPKGTVGLFELLQKRYPVIYTDHLSDEMDPWVKKFVNKSPELDRLWISGTSFEQMLQGIFNDKPLNRFGRIVFQFDNIYGEDIGTDEDSNEGEPVDDENNHDENTYDGDAYIPERRATRFTLIDKLSVIQEKLPDMRRNYAPLHAITQLRFPARGQGGHDVYFNGKATNRSSSFNDHRQHLQYVLDVYKRAIRETEIATWGSSERTSIAAQGDKKLRTGVPVVMIFSESLSPTRFASFVKNTFDRAQSKLGLWGNPIKLGQTKVHVYAVDRHLWQPLFLEITEKQIVIVVPNGTCGNTVHRLVTNIQQYLDPAVKVWVGDRTYDSLIDVKAGGDNE